MLRLLGNMVKNKKSDSKYAEDLIAIAEDRRHLYEPEPWDNQFYESTMEHETFDNLVSVRLDKCKEILSSKSKEYSSGEDRLHNFVVAGRARNVAPPTALEGMMMKHLVSMWDMIDKMEEDPSYVPTRELVAEKLGDVINYTLLLEGLIEDRRDSLCF